jgi:hypothetical protein
MANGSIKGILLVGGMLILSMQGWAQRGPGMGMGVRGSDNAGSCQTLIASLPRQDLSATEAAGLTYLREEEKVAAMCPRSCMPNGARASSATLR